MKSPDGRVDDAMKKRLAFFVVLMFTVVLSAVAAEANGTITATVLYSGQPVSGAYMYLQSGSQLSPRELYYHNASYILGPSDASGNISGSVPAGAYYVRITKRTGSGVSYLGPPYPGDYIWIYAANPPTVTVTDNGTLALGTVSATSYETITLSGTVKGASGKVLAGWAVKAATVPCESGNWSYSHSFNECGTGKHPTVTDANGNYSITLMNTGTYYVYASPGLNFANTNYPGGYPTCATAVGCEACGSYFYYNCPTNVASTGVTGVNVVVPGY